MCTNTIVRKLTPVIASITSKRVSPKNMYRVTEHKVYDDECILNWGWGGGWVRACVRALVVKTFKKTAFERLRLIKGSPRLIGD